MKIKKCKEIDKNVFFCFVFFLFLMEFYSYTENILTKRHCTKEMNKKIIIIIIISLFADIETCLYQ